jgi:two-component system, OmpR family, KDP operon response regulator KdpE
MDRGKIRVLVVDDEPQIRRALRVGLEHNDYAVILAENGDEGLDQAAAQSPDIVILDLAMPGMDGFEVLRELRGWSPVPVIVLSVREGEEDKIRALDLGADDYLTKPFSLGELLARIRAALRRRPTGAEEEPASVTAGELFIDFARRSVTIASAEVHLTPIEYGLLRLLALSPGRVLTHRQLLTRVWGAEYAEDTHTLRVHMANLRGKIEPDPTRPRYIHTEPRVGYRFRPDQA